MRLARTIRHVFVLLAVHLFAFTAFGGQNRADCKNLTRKIIFSDHSNVRASVEKTTDGSFIITENNETRYFIPSYLPYSERKELENAFAVFTAHSPEEALRAAGYKNIKNANWHAVAANAVKEARDKFMVLARRTAEKHLRDATGGGFFTRASPAKQAELGAVFLRSGATKKITGKVKRVGEEDIAINLNKSTDAQLAGLVQAGRDGLKELVYFTSGAGLWSRGGGQVKALLPFNLKDLMSAEDFKRLVKLSNILTASSPATILKAAGRQLRSWENSAKIAENILARSKLELDKLVSAVERLPEALNPVDLKLVNVAIQSEKAGTYIPLIIWSSEQTHGKIKSYLDFLKSGFRKKIFDPDPAKNAKIHEVLAKYFAAAKKRDDTHLFGYQVGLHAFDPRTGVPLQGTPAIGEGAGMAKAYMDSSGLTAKLQKEGKTTWVFENIEVITDLPLAMGAHIRAGKPVSVIVVPELPKYKGGNPFMIKKGNEWNMELREQSALPEEYTKDNKWFNSNTIFQPLSIRPPQNVGYEIKNAGAGKIARVKMNAGDVTLENRTAGIGGRIGIEYENFKNYTEFGENGEKLITTYRSIWTRDLKQASAIPTHQ